MTRQHDALARIQAAHDEPPVMQSDPLTGLDAADLDATEDAPEDDDHICSRCAGSGEGPADGTRCSVCHGSGETRAEREDDFDPPDPRDDGPEVWP